MNHEYAVKAWGLVDSKPQVLLNRIILSTDPWKDVLQALRDSKCAAEMVICSVTLSTLLPPLNQPEMRAYFTSKRKMFKIGENGYAEEYTQSAIEGVLSSEDTFFLRSGAVEDSLFWTTTWRDAPTVMHLLEQDVKIGTRVNDEMRQFFVFDDVVFVRDVTFPF